MTREVPHDACDELLMKHAVFKRAWCHAKNTANSSAGVYQRALPAPSFILALKRRSHGNDTPRAHLPSDLSAPQDFLPCPVASEHPLDSFARRSSLLQPTGAVITSPQGTYRTFGEPTFLISCSISSWTSKRCSRRGRQLTYIVER